MEPHVKSNLTGMEYSFEIGEDEMSCLLQAEELVAFPSLAETLTKIEGVRSVAYDGHFGCQVVVGFLVNDNQECIGFSEASRAIEEHLKACEQFLIYVGSNEDDV